jgi:membrane protease YdiL (CAAX protease family)
MTDIDNNMRKSFKNYFIAIWIISSIFFGMELVFGFAASWMIKSTNFLYIISLIFLFLTSDFLSERVIVSEKIINLKGYDIWGLLLIIVGATTLFLFLGLKTSVILIMAIVTFIVSVWIIVKYKKLITKPLIIKGLIIGALCGLSQYNYFLSFLFISILTPFFFISASLLNDKFKLTAIHLNNNSYASIIKSFLIGCLFALPMALSNLSDVLATNPYKWINHFWQPILAFNFVLLEETFMRLFIITFIYVLVSSKTDKKIIPVITAILISSTIFGLSHYPHVDIMNCINIAVLYGLPLGVLFYKRDFETVVGYHFMINFISAVSTYAMTN